MAQKIIVLSLLLVVKMKHHISLKLILLILYSTAILGKHFEEDLGIIDVRLPSSAAVNLDEECGIINIDRYKDESRITDIDEFPWMARVAFNSSSSSAKEGEIIFKCLAVLITDKHLLSVAQCFRHNYEEPFAVVLGDWDTRNEITEKDCNAAGVCSQPLLIEIDEIIIHPYNNYRRRVNDINILKLKQAVTFTDFIRPICLPSADVQSTEFGSDQLMLTGWLFTRDGLKGDVKQKMSVFIFNINDCRRKLQNFEVGSGERVNITDSYLCGITCNRQGNYLAASALMDIVATTEDDDNQSTPTPTPTRVHLIGLVSFGVSFCGSRLPDVMVRVDRYIDWIKENIY